MYGGATFDLDRKVHMAHIAIILSENNLSDIIIEEIVCRNTCLSAIITYESPFTSFCGIMNP